MVQRLLRDSETYKIISQDPTKRYVQELDDVLWEAKRKNLISR